MSLLDRVLLAEGGGALHLRLTLSNGKLGKYAKRIKSMPGGEWFPVDKRAGRRIVVLPFTAAGAQLADELVRELGTLGETRVEVGTPVKMQTVLVSPRKGDTVVGKIKSRLGLPPADGGTR